jgi:predicted amidohydrolase
MPAVGFYLPNTRQAAKRGTVASVRAALGNSCRLCPKYGQIVQVRQMTHLPTCKQYAGAELSAPDRKPSRAWGVDHFLQNSAKSCPKAFARGESGQV